MSARDEAAPRRDDAPGGVPWWAREREGYGDACGDGCEGTCTCVLSEPRWTREDDGDERSE